MRLRLLIGLTVLITLFCAGAAQASPGALNILVSGNSSGVPENLADELSFFPDVASIDIVDTTVDTPLASDLAPYDLVVSLGDSNYFDQETWGDSLADYIDGGGTVLQAAYDNWDNPPNDLASPKGRFASGGYAPLLNGPNDNDAVTLGTIVVPGSPILQGLGDFPNSDNTTTPLAPGATLLAKWSDGRNAIAVKGRVVATSASADELQVLPDLARLALNTVHYFGKHKVSVTPSGTGTGTVSGSTPGIYALGTVLNFSATPAPDSVFAGWTGPCAGVGACTVTINGADLSIGAVFNLAAFGSKTNVSLSARSPKVSSNGKLKIKLKNRNGFSVKGTLSTSKVKSKKFSIKANGSSTVQLTLPKSLKKKLADNGRLKVTIKAKIKDPAGTLRTVRKKLTLKPKG